MQILKCAIVDDESFAIELLADKLKLFSNLDLVETFTNPELALLKIGEEDSIDILFLDIDMPGMTGLELGAKLRKRVKYLIFTTAFSNYALDAFGVKANDYLLKPIEQIRFIESIQSILSLERKRQSTNQSNLLFIKSNLKGKFLSVKLSEVSLIYVEGHKLIMISNDQRYETTESLKNIEARLSDDIRFLRVHNSNLINIEKIVKIEGNTIELIGRYKVPVSDRYKEKLMSVVGLKYEKH
jgi:DNA-binding LytR/AlgR family response regulator